MQPVEVQLSQEVGPLWASFAPQELRDLMARQHDEELQRLRDELERLHRSSRSAQSEVLQLEAW